MSYAAAMQPAMQPLGGRGQKAARLPRPQPGIKPALRQQCAVAALFKDTTLIQNHDSVHLRNGRQAVRNGQNGFALHHGIKALNLENENYSFLSISFQPFRYYMLTLSKQDN